MYVGDEELRVYFADKSTHFHSPLGICQALPSTCALSHVIPLHFVEMRKAGEQDVFGANDPKITVYDIVGRSRNRARQVGDPVGLGEFDRPEERREIALVSFSFLVCHTRCLPKFSAFRTCQIGPTKCILFQIEQIKQEKQIFHVGGVIRGGGAQATDDP